MNINIEQELWKGIHRTRTFSESIHLKSIIENHIKFKPRYWIGLTFPRKIEISTAINKIDNWFLNITRGIFKSHIQPIVGLNTQGDYVVNDIHCILLIENRKSVHASWYYEQFKEMKRYWRKNRGRIIIEEYDESKFGIPYITTRHKEIPFQTHCPNRHRQCKKGKCIYNNKQNLLLR